MLFHVTCPSVCLFIYIYISYNFYMYVHCMYTIYYINHTDYMYYVEIFRFLDCFRPSLPTPRVFSLSEETKKIKVNTRLCQISSSLIDVLGILSGISLIKVSQHFYYCLLDQVSTKFSIFFVLLS